MHYPKQVINSINYLNYFKSFIFKDENLEKEIKKKYKIYLILVKKLNFQEELGQVFFQLLKLFLKIQ